MDLNAEFADQARACGLVPLVIFPGLGMPTTALSMCYEGLSRRLFPRRVLIVDWAGSGLSARSATAVNWRKLRESCDRGEIDHIAGPFAEAFERFRKKEKIERMVLLGHSLGAYLASAYVTSEWNTFNTINTKPEEVQKLIDTTTGSRHQQAGTGAAGMISSRLETGTRPSGPQEDVGAASRVVHLILVSPCGLPTQPQHVPADRFHDLDYQMNFAQLPEHDFTEFNREKMNKTYRSRRAQLLIRIFVCLFFGWGCVCFPCIFFGTCFRSMWRCQCCFCDPCRRRKMLKKKASKKKPSPDVAGVRADDESARASRACGSSDVSRPLSSVLENSEEEEDHPLSAKNLPQTPGSRLRAAPCLVARLLTRIYLEIRFIDNGQWSVPRAVFARKPRFFLGRGRRSSSKTKTTEVVEDEHCTSTLQIGKNFYEVHHDQEQRGHQNVDESTSKNQMTSKSTTCPPKQHQVVEVLGAGPRGGAQHQEQEEVLAATSKSKTTTSRIGSKKSKNCEVVDDSNKKMILHACPGGRWPYANCLASTSRAGSVADTWSDSFYGLTMFPWSYRSYGWQRFPITERLVNTFLRPFPCTRAAPGGLIFHDVSANPTSEKNGWKLGLEFIKESSTPVGCSVSRTSRRTPSRTGINEAPGGTTCSPLPGGKIKSTSSCAAPNRLSFIYGKHDWMDWRHGDRIRSALQFAMEPRVSSEGEPRESIEKRYETAMEDRETKFLRVGRGCRFIGRRESPDSVCVEERDHASSSCSDHVGPDGGVRPLLERSADNPPNGGGSALPYVVQVDQVVRVERAGHQLFAENPRGFVDAICSLLIDVDKDDRRV